MRPLFLAFVTLAGSAAEQVTLLPAINASTLPADGEPVCTLPFQTPPIESSGRPVGESAADFTAFDLDGNAFNLADALALGKPVLMISASYTCPVFRNRIPSINNVVATYGDALTTMIVYTAEAHPYIDISPYFGAVNTHGANIAAGILYRQPTTYGERKSVVQAMVDPLTIHAPIYLDGPCNEWWDYYGQAPNCAYLIDSTGSIFAHHAWYDKFPQNIMCDIDSLLGNPVDCTGSFTGQFDMAFTSNDTIHGDAGTTLYGSALLWAEGPDDVLVRMVKMNTDLPSDWSSSLCADICYLPHIDTALVTLTPGDTLHFYYYFYTGASADTGYARIGFRNENDVDNRFDRRFWGIAQAPNAVPGTLGVPVLKGYPNPVRDRLMVEGQWARTLAWIVDATGRRCAHFVLAPGTNSIPMDGLGTGLYRLCTENGAVLPFVKE